MLTQQVALKTFANDEFAPIYLFFGEEAYLQEVLVKNLYRAFIGEGNDFGLEKIAGESFSLQEIINRVDEGGLFSRRRLMIVDQPPYLAPPRKSVRQEEESTEKSQEEEKTGSDLLSQYIARLGTTVPDKLIVFLTPGVDRRKKIFKVIDKNAVTVECAPLKGDELGAWINSRAAELGKRIDRVALDRLLMAGEQSLHFFSNELEKYAIYLGDTEKVITGRTVELLFAGDLESSVFKMADALAEGSHSRAQAFLDLLLGRREKPLSIFFMLVRHYRLLLQVRCFIEEGLPLTEITRTMAVHPFVARKLKDQAMTLDGQVLEDIYIALQKADLQIKTGVLDPIQALRLILSRIDYLQNKNT